MRIGSGSSKYVSAYLFALGAALLVASSLTTRVGAAPTGPTLGTAGSFGVLAGAGVTNTGPTTVAGDLGTCPNPSISGFPPGTVGGTIHANDAVACGAQSDTTIAYNDAAGRAPTTTYGGPTDLGGLTLTAGVYMTPTSFALTGSLVLDGADDPDSTFIFQAGSTLITATNSAISMINGAQACNVFWQVGSSATLGVGSQFKGTVLALTSITANTDAGVEGRLLARNGAVTLDSNVITRPACSTAPTTTITPATTTAPATTSGSVTTTPETTVTTVASPTPTTAAPTATTIATPTTVAPPIATTAVATTAVATTSTSSPSLPTTSGSSTTVSVPPSNPSTTRSFAGNPPTSASVTVTPAATAPARTTSALPRTGGLSGGLAVLGLGALVLGGLVRRVGARRHVG